MISLSQIVLIGSVLLFPGPLTGETPSERQAPAAAVSPSAGAPGLVWTEPGPTGLTAASLSRARARPVAGQRIDGFEFPEAHTLDVSYVGPNALIRQMTHSLVRPTALAAADFDGDGTPEMVVGYTGPAGHIVALHPGNPDAIHPHSPEARARKAAGTFTDEPFLTPARLYGAPAAPDFMEAGDFDGDGHQDVVLATLGGTKLHLLAGDGRGGLSAGRGVALPGPLSVLASGEINLRDLRPDLAAGVMTDEGPALLIFEARPGALEAAPEEIELPAPATGFAFGRLDDGSFLDLAVAAGNDVLLVEGRNRRTFLRSELRGEIETARVRTVASLDSPIRSIATGDYVWQDGARRTELALLTADGSLQVVGRGTAANWTTLGGRQVAGPVDANGGLLVTARVSGLPLEEVVVLDRAGRRLAATLGDVPAAGERAAGELLEPLVRPLDHAPIAALPMRLDRNNLSDLVVLRDGLTAPAVSAAPAAVITVTDGAPDLGPAPNGLCSLSEALDNANGNGLVWADCAPGAGPGDVISFAIGAGGPVTILVGFIGGPVTYPPGTYEMNDPGGDVIDGFTQGCAFGPCIGLDGFPAGAPGNGLNVFSRGNVVRGLAIHGFPGSGIEIGFFGNTVEGNFLGLDITAFPAGNGAAGVTLIDADTTLIGGFGGPPPFPGNTISANAADGVSVIETAFGLGGLNEIIFNFVGTDPAGAADLGNGALGVSLTETDGNSVLDNLVSGNTSDGIGTTQAGSAADDNMIFDNTVGLDLTRAFAIPNDLSGVRLDGGERNIIGGNFISGNTVHGVHTFTGTAGFVPFDNTIEANVIGLDGGATAALGNGGLGVAMFDSPNNFVINNTVSANGSYGIAVGSFPPFGPGSADSNLIADNIVGLDGAGLGILLGNTFSGVLIQDASFTDVVGNTSSGNGFLGGYGHGAEIAPVNFSPFDSVFNTIRGNRLGTDISGVGDLGNFLEGVRIADANDNLVGGPLDSDRNFLCGNDFAGAVIVDFAGAGASGNRFENNAIGEDASGLPVPNGGPGVLIQDAAFNVIGGSCPSCGNRIHNNPAEGVLVYESVPFPVVGNVVRHNSIRDNAALGIDLAADGVTPNDGPIDPDLGPNGLQNFPDVGSVFVGLSDTVIAGSLDSLAGTSFDTEFFANGACDPSLFGEGDVLLGHDSVTTTAAGLAPFTAIFPSAVPAGTLITATATGPDGTSEFSECVAAVPCPALGAFPQTILAPDKTKLEWPVAANIKFVEGPLSGLSTYTFTGSGTAENATMIPTGGNPTVGTGRYFALREWGCASWQTVPGTEPGRDLNFN